jgi:hypothetical protein
MGDTDGALGSPKWKIGKLEKLSAGKGDIK